MLRNLCVGTVVAALCGAMLSPAMADNRVSNSKKGSLLVYSKVELRWICAPGGCRFVQDTFIDMSNDFPADVDVQLYFVNGDEPTDEVTMGDPPVVVERAHPGWNWADCQITLTGDQPWYMSMFTGLPGGCQPFEVLDPAGIGGPGRPDPEGRPGERMLRGFVYAWAVNADGEQIRWNHLAGDALILNYAFTSAAEYNVYAFQALLGDNGDQIGTPGVLNLDGIEYDLAYDKLLMDFYASGLAFMNDTDITLHPVSADLRQDNEGPVVTKAKFDIWNQNEVRFSGTEKCITCWDQTLASNYPAPNHLLARNLQTAKGKARIDGLGSTQCPLSVDAAMLGIQIKLGDLGGPRGVTTAINMVGQGEQAAVIRWDVISGPGDATAGN